MRVYIRRFAANPFSYKAIKNAALAAVNEYALDVAAEYNDTVETFSSELAAVPIADTDGKKIVVNIYVRGDPKDVENYIRLDRGFVRRVPIVPGYQHKTRPGIIGSFPGGGIVGRGVLKQPVRVEARRFTETIAANIRDGAMVHGKLSEHVSKRLRQRIKNLAKVGTWEIVK